MVVTKEVSPPDITIAAFTSIATEVSANPPAKSVTRRVTEYVPTAVVESAFTIPVVVSTLTPDGGEITDQVLVLVPFADVNAVEVFWVP